MSAARIETCGGAFPGVAMTDVALIVRPAESDDWPKLRAIRLEALTDAPEAFGSTYAVAAKLSNYQWRAMIERSLYFLAERDGYGRRDGLGRAQRSPPGNALAVRHVRDARCSGLSDGRRCLVDAVADVGEERGSDASCTCTSPRSPNGLEPSTRGWDLWRRASTSGWIETPASS